MGSLEYYLTTMKAGEVVDKIRVAKELPQWENMTIEERMQRDLDWKRIEKEIARFMATDPDRFYGALLVAIYNNEGLSFESLEELSGLPKLYANAAGSFGFLHFQGGELLFALDGQHRLKGTAVAISGLGEKGKELEDFPRNLEVAKDDVAIMLIPFSPASRARKIFNKVNKYAKSTSKGDNVITSEDDTYAIIARRLMMGVDGRPPVIPEPLVNWRSNTLTERMTKFTTISVLYESAKVLLGKVDTQFRPDEEKLDEHYEQVRQVWEALLDKFSIFNRAVKKSREALPDQRKQYLCLKPAGQLALIEAIRIARTHGMELDTIIEGLNRIPWGIEDPLWQRIMMLGDKIQAGRQAVYLTGRLVALLIGTPYEEKEREKLLRDYQKALGDDPDKPCKVKTLPDPLV
jgi:DNA sulfur modification protein DndB